jgi:hypothetical protein
MKSGKAISVKTPVNQEKPKAYRSPLWAHLDEIHKWRMAQQTWEAISDKLFAQYGIKVSLQCVQAFFQRAARRGFRRPLGFGRERSGSIAAETAVTPRRPRAGVSLRRGAKSHQNRAAIKAEDY